MNEAPTIAEHYDRATTIERDVMRSGVDYDGWTAEHDRQFGKPCAVGENDTGWLAALVDTITGDLIWFGDVGESRIAKSDAHREGKRRADAAG